MATVFVELAGEPGTSLDGLSLAGVNGFNGERGPIIALAGVIGEDGLFVVADRTSAGSSFVLETDLLANFDFQNGPDSIVLMDGEFVLDAVGYGVFDEGEVFAGEGLPAPDAPAGSSLARPFADLDTDDNAADFWVLVEPTPGSAIFQAVPEPGTGLLLVSGLATLAHLRRGRTEVAHEGDSGGAFLGADAKVGECIRVRGGPVAGVEAARSVMCERDS